MLNEPNTSIVLLDKKQHDRESFLCGVSVLDNYLKRQASQDAKKNVASTFVMADKEGTIAGYYTLSATGINAEDLPEEIVKKLPRYPLLPAALLGRLAVDNNYQGKGIGKILLMDGLRRSFEIKTEMASMAVIVDAKDDSAKKFYEKYGFMSFPKQPYKLLLPMSSISVLLKG